MPADYTLFLDLAAEADVPTDGILSRTLFQDDRLKVVLFAFAADQELSEHTASVPAIVHVLEGEAELRLGDERIDARAGTWAHMPARLKHAIHARTPTKMLLVMLKGG
jgi:quercetin dioxygenase-like cupin family protein